MNAAERNLIRYLEDNYPHDPEVAEAIREILEDDRDLFMDHLCEVIRADREQDNG